MTIEDRYWIEDDGTLRELTENGDTHEADVVGRAQSELADLIGSDWKDGDDFGSFIDDALEKSGFRSLDEWAVKNCDDLRYFRRLKAIAFDLGEPKMFAMQEWGWVCVAGRQIHLAKLTSETISCLIDGIRKILSLENYDFLEGAPELEITTFAASHSLTLADLESQKGRAQVLSEAHPLVTPILIPNAIPDKSLSVLCPGCGLSIACTPVEFGTTKRCRNCQTEGILEIVIRKPQLSKLEEFGRAHLPPLSQNRLVDKCGATLEDFYGNGWSTKSARWCEFWFGLKDNSSHTSSYTLSVRLPTGTTIDGDIAHICTVASRCRCMRCLSCAIAAFLERVRVFGESGAWNQSAIKTVDEWNSICSNGYLSSSYVTDTRETLAKLTALYNWPAYWADKESLEKAQAMLNPIIREYENQIVPTVKAAVAREFVKDMLKLVGMIVAAVAIFRYFTRR